MQHAFGFFPMLLVSTLVTKWQWKKCTDYQTSAGPTFIIRKNGRPIQSIQKWTRNTSTLYPHLASCEYNHNSQQQIWWAVNNNNTARPTPVPRRHWPLSKYLPTYDIFNTRTVEHAGSLNKDRAQKSNEARLAKENSCCRSAWWQSWAMTSSASCYFCWSSIV